MIARHSLYGAAVALLVALWVVVVGIGFSDLPDGATRPVEAPTPILLPARLSVPEPTLRSMTYSEWRESTPRGIVTEDEVVSTLLDVGMPADSARALARAVVECESPVRESSGRSIGSSVTSRGDQGLSRGPFQIHVGWNPQYADTDLFDLNEGARAAVAIWRQQGLSAWACIGARP